MGKKRKKGKRRRRNHAVAKPVLKPACVAAIEQLEAVRDEAREHDIFVVVSVVQCGRRTKTYHFMFDGLEGRILNYWPGNGTVYSPVTRTSKKVPDVWAALDLAVCIFSERIAETPEEAHIAAIARRHE